MTTLRAIGEVIRKERERRMLSATALCAAAVISRNTLRGLEQGTGNVELATLLSICDILKLDLLAIPQDVANALPSESPAHEVSFVRKKVMEKMGGEATSLKRAMGIPKSLLKKP